MNFMTLFELYHYSSFASSYFWPVFRWLFLKGKNIHVTSEVHCEPTGMKFINQNIWLWNPEWKFFFSYQKYVKTIGLEILWFVLLGNELYVSIGRQHLLLALVECEALNFKKIVLFLEKVF